MGGCPISLDSKRWAQASSIHRIPQSLGAVASFANLEVVFQVSRGALEICQRHTPEPGGLLPAN